MSPEGLRFDAFLRGAIREISDAEPLVALPLHYSAVVLEKDMATLSAMAERIAQKKAVHQQKADEWAKRLDAIDKVEPAMFAAGDEVVAAQEEDIAGFEAEMKTVGKNIAPLARSSAGSNNGAGVIKKEE